MALVDGLHGCIQFRLACEHDLDGVWRAGAEAVQELDAVHARHPEVREHHGQGTWCGEGLQARLPGLGREHFEVRLKQPSQSPQQQNIVIHQQDAWLHGVLPG